MKYLKVIQLLIDLVDAVTRLWETVLPWLQ